MIRRVSGLLLLSALCALPFLAYHVSNWLRYGASFIVGDDLLDKIMYWAAFPGFLIGLFVALVLAGNVHNYNLYLAQAIAVMTNGFLYGILLWLLLHWAKRRPTPQAAPRCRLTKRCSERLPVVRPTFPMTKLIPPPINARLR